MMKGSAATVVCLLALGYAILTLRWGVGDETEGWKGVYAKTTRPYTHLVCPQQDLCSCDTRPSTAGDGARKRGSVGSLVDDPFLLLLPRAIRVPQCAQRVPETRSGLLVCLPHQREPNPQALSRTKRDIDPGSLRGGSTRPGQRAHVYPSCAGEERAVVRAEGSAALQQAFSSPSAKLAGRARSLAHRAGCGVLSLLDARLGLCWQWEDHPLLGRKKGAGQPEENRLLSGSPWTRWIMIRTASGSRSSQPCVLVCPSLGR